MPGECCAPGRAQNPAWIRPLRNSDLVLNCLYKLWVQVKLFWGKDLLSGGLHSLSALFPHCSENEPKFSQFLLMRTHVLSLTADGVKEMGRGETHIYFPLWARAAQRSPVQFMVTDEWRTRTWALSETQAYWISHFSNLDLLPTKRWPCRQPCLVVRLLKPQTVIRT